MSDQTGYAEDRQRKLWGHQRAAQMTVNNRAKGYADDSQRQDKGLRRQSMLAQRATQKAVNTRTEDIQ